MTLGGGGTVLIGFADALAAPEVVFGLLRAGHRVRAFERAEGSRPAIRRLPLGPPLAVTPPERDAAASVADLRAALAADPEIDTVLALDDAALWLVDRALAGGGPAAASATGERAAFALDKRRQIAAAAEAGLAVLPTAIVERRDEVPAAPERAMILKPAEAVALRDGGLAKTPAHYHWGPESHEALPERFPGPYLLQPLVRGTGEGVFGFALADGVAAWSGHRRLRMMNPHGSGASAAVANPPAPELRACVARLMAGIGWRGPFMVELLRAEDGTPWFMEVNGRLWGSLALARRAGLAYPAWAVALARDPAFRPPETPDPPAGLVARHLGRELLHLGHVLRGPRSAFHRAGWPGFWRSLAGVMAPTRLSGFYNWSPSHPAFFLREAADTVLRAVRGR